MTENPIFVSRREISLVRDNALTTLLWQSIVAFVVLGAISAILGWWLTGRVLSRVHRMTAQARQISTANLHERIALDGPHDELKELSDTFDELLTRLDDAFHTQGRFIANASHELRTPLAVTRTAIQVGLSPIDSPQVQRVKEHLLRSNDRSISLINGLLELAKGEQGLHERHPVRLDEVARQVVSEATTPGLRVRVATVKCEVLGDALFLSQIVRNLVDNAVRYNVPGGEIRVDVGMGTRTGTLTVGNTGAVVPADEVELLFEPFRRGSVQRTGRAEGTGLGLSIVRALVNAHDGTVIATPREGGGLDVTVELPLAESQAALVTPRRR
jgi:signal transduction histidine kinase